MSVFDLVALIAGLATIGTLIAAFIAAFRGRGANALRILRRWAICAVAYLLISVGVSYVRPQRALALGDPWCLDDWCLQVQTVGRATIGPLLSYGVNFRVYSTAQRITQHAPAGSELFLIDDQERRYLPNPDPSAPPLTVELGPEQSVDIHRVFEVPVEAHVVGLTQTHGGTFCGIGSLLIIGEGGCLFNKPTVIQLHGVE